ncbi:Tetratricopeptide repeat-containing protein [Malonomonas rubra DSM 5091]|uniref:Tetratricopeptide repeat-containing protein n=1 Tax=Malonomonas rubra DSM 5091 TaxID=1122189 RepID=A0A1M6G5V7_MALRU|nr:tetratricopeptide repeat protein [Malonomonas rubra]SHJ05309.1 Tetratricopeptide repeat-containing protein [Malonomonas rubra DSM 5091]
MEKKNFIPMFISILMIGLLSGPAIGEDTNIVFKHDQTGIADEVNKMKDFDFELQRRDRERMKEWRIEDSTDAMKVGDTYFAKGEIEDAISFYQLAIKIDPANSEAHEKYITARNREKETASAHYHQAMEYDRKGMKDKAIDELILEIKENPDNEQARIKLNEIESR